MKLWTKLIRIHALEFEYNLLAYHSREFYDKILYISFSSFLIDDLQGSAHQAHLAAHHAHLAVQVLELN